MGLRARDDYSVTGNFGLTASVPNAAQAWRTQFLPAGPARAPSNVYQDVALLLQPTVVAAQPRQLLTLGYRQSTILARRRAPSVNGRLCHLIAHGLR